MSGNNLILSPRKDGKRVESTRNISLLIADMKSLVKGLVLVSNVLPVFTGLWLAAYFTNTPILTQLDIFLLTMIGSIMVIAGALILNNWYDVDIDAIMERTKKRPTVTGNFPLNVVLIIGIIVTIVGFIFLLFTTIEAAIYAFIGWFTYVVLYTMWSKRRYTFNTVIGSVSGAVTPLIGWAAIEPTFHTVPLILFLILLIWQMPHTFAIAIKKCDEYKAAGVAMLPVVSGINMTKRQMVLYIASLLPLPFFLASLGFTFIIFATILNVSWLLIALSGFFTKDHYKWAHVNFIYSVNYITLLYCVMILATSI